MTATACIEDEGRYVLLLYLFISSRFFFISRQYFSPHAIKPLRSWIRFLCPIVFLSIKGVEPAKKGLRSLLSTAVRVGIVAHSMIVYNIGRYMHPNGTS
jgi:hypothetical protein